MNQLWDIENSNLVLGKIAQKLVLPAAVL